MLARFLQIKLISALILIVFSIVFGNAAYADYDVDDLKKLFTDKKQRARIDAMRSGNYSGSDQLPTSKVKVSGYLIRSDGKSVVWVNSKNTMDGSRLGNLKVNQSSVGKNKKVTVTLDGKTKRLKPGETWHKESDKVVDNQ